MAWPKWKKFEKDVAILMGWKRKVRANNYAEIDTDIEPPQELSFLKIDCKKHKKMAHHGLMYEIERKYCEETGDQPVLFTQEVLSPSTNIRHKSGQKLPTYVTITADLFKELIDSHSKIISEKK